MIGKTNIPMGMSKGETVSILLKTNQSSNEDLNGVKVVVSYDDESHEYTYNGQFSVEIPKDKTYTVTFGEVDGYKTPSSVTYTSVKGFSRSIEVTYYSERVTVNVSAEGGASVDGQAVKVSKSPSIDDGEEYTITNGKASFSVPYDETYTVSLSDMDGYTTPESQTYTASQPTREISMEYKKAVEHVIVNVSSDDNTNMDGYKVYVRPNVANGVYIQDVDGNLYTESEWDTMKVANGIAVVTDECSFVIALEDARENVQWSQYGNARSLTKATYAEAALDFNGLGNTNNMISTASSTNNAAQYCRDYIFPNGQTGYLGAVGEWNAVANSFDEIEELLSVIGAESFKEYSWASTENTSDMGVYAYNKSTNQYVAYFYNYNANVRAFTELGSTYTITNGKVEFDVPTGVDYVISVEDIDGYTTPEPQSFVAELGTRTVDMVYEAVKLGVFIQGVSGKLYETDAWASQETPNGVAVITEECSFVIALTESYTMRIHSSASGALENYMTAIPNETQAKADYDGAANTANIIKLQSGINYAAGWCDDFLFPSLRYGFLPSLGQMWAAYSNKSAVDAALNKAGGMELLSDYYWTSTFRGISNTNRYRLCWTLVWSIGVVSSRNLYTYFRVRAFSDL